MGGRCPLVVGHRANTARWARRYIREGADGIEVDVSVVDGRVRLGHPPPRRGSPLLRERIARLIEGLHLLPPLSPEALARLLPPGSLLWVDVKTRGALRAVEEFAGLAGVRLAVSTRYHDEARLLASRARGAEVMLSMESRPPTIEPLIRASGAGGVALESSYIDEGLVAEAHGMGVKVAAWTVDDEGEMERLIGLGVDFIITNYPGVARRLCSRAASRG